MNLSECIGRVIRVRWQDIVEDTASSGNPDKIKAALDGYALQDTHGILLHIDNEVFVATTRPALEQHRDDDTNYSVIRIPLAILRRVDVVAKWRRVSLK